MTNSPTARGATPVRRADGHDDEGNSWWKWLLGLLLILALVIAGFFLLGGDVDGDVDPGNVDIEVPEVDVDVDAPDVDVEVPDVDVDVDGGDVDIEDGDAEADVDE